MKRELPVRAVGLMVLVALSGCSRGASQTSDISTQNQFTQASCGSEKQIGGFTALCGSTVQAKIASGQVAAPGSTASKSFFTKLSAKSGIFYTASQKDSTPPPSTTAPTTTPPTTTTPAPTPTGNQLILSFPVGLLGEEYLFGGVITKVSDKTNTNFGDLKLTDLPPANVRPMIANSDTANPELVLVGCANDCKETSAQEDLIGFPIVGTDSTTNSVLVDLAAVAKDLDLMAMLDPDGSATGLKSTATRTLSFDYSLSTLVFDIATDMVPGTPTPPAPNALADKMDGGPTPTASPAPVVTTFTTRWYLRLASAFSSSFVPRPATPGVGFFMTERSANPVIERQSLEQIQGPALHYYIKNFPAEYQPVIQAALDDWNTKLTTLVGRPLLSYEFVPAGDPRNDQLVPGDIRYRIIEWDVDNDASYGGLGPSIANQFTGEILTSNILIQGPTIVQLYTDWFKVQDTAAQLATSGRSSEAENLLKDFTMTYQNRQAKFTKVQSMHLNSKLAMRITGQMPALHDPIGDFSAINPNPVADRNDFLDLPPDVTYATYMAGYFQDMVEHEMGHNLGLRHNFRGNLGADDQNGTVAPQRGKVSRSVMEYLNRTYRYLDFIDPYDLMALDYGYNGKAPSATNEFCTDEDQPSAEAPTASAECTENDATSDPFSWWQAQLSRVIDKLTARTDTTGAAPTWALTDMTTEVGQVLVGLGSYSSSAAATAAGWTNFFGKAGRPATAADVPAYVKGVIKSQLCDPALVTVAAAKTTPAGQQAVTKNLTDLRAAAATQLAPFGFTAADLSCN